MPIPKEKLKQWRTEAMASLASSLRAGAERDPGLSHAVIALLAEREEREALITALHAERFDPTRNEVTIHGVRYSIDLFAHLGILPPGEWIRIEKREGETLTLRRVSEPHLIAEREDLEEHNAYLERVRDAAWVVADEAESLAGFVRPEAGFDAAAIQKQADRAEGAREAMGDLGAGRESPAALYARAGAERGELVALLREIESHGPVGGEFKHPSVHSCPCCGKPRGIGTQEHVQGCRLDAFLRG
jgi:hypothetical protein